MTLDELCALNDAWLQAWTEKHAAKIASMYAPDCRFMDAMTAGGLTGREALLGYLGKIFPATPAWTYRPDELWAIPGGFCARWFCDMEGGRRLRGFDFVQIDEDGLIAYNEVYTHELPD